MASNFDPSTLMNPVALWTDLGLRAIEMAVSSTQSISEGVDRFARAGASVEAAEDAASSSAVSRRTAAATSSGVALAADLQRSTFDLLTRGWLQWMSALGSVASLAASIAPGGRWMRQSVPLEAMRKALLPAGWADRAGTQPQPGSASRQHEGQRREVHAESGAMEHALASAESKRRRSSGTGRTKAKPKARRSRS